MFIYIYQLAEAEAKTIMITLSNSKNKHHIIVCCSGGADSMALLMMCYQYVHEYMRSSYASVAHNNSIGVDVKDNHLLNSELPKQQHCSITMSVFHVKHGLSPNQHDWANLVQSKCDSLNIPLHIVEVNPNQHSLSETEARKLRYEALDEYIANQVLDGKDANAVDVIVVTGHHKNDRLENYLISLFKNRTHNFDLINHVKNSGVHSVAVSYQKPLLNMTKDELVDYCHQHQLDFVHDESNDVSDNLRNIIRNQLFKYMDKLKHKAQYMISLERFFDNYKTFNEFYIASVRQFISTMQVKVIECSEAVSAKLAGARDNAGAIENEDGTDSLSASPNLTSSIALHNTQLANFVQLRLATQLQLRYSCSMDELKQASHGKYVEFAAHLVQILYNDYCLNLSSKNTTSDLDKPLGTSGTLGTNDLNTLKYVNRFNFHHFIQFFPKLECNNKQYKVDDFLCVWIKDGKFFIKIKAISV